MQLFFLEEILKVSTVESLMVLNLLLLLAKYSSKENSQVVASKERWPGDVLPEILQEFGQRMYFNLGQVSKSIMRTDE